MCATEASPERVNPPQQRQKAPQTAGGFTCTNAAPAEARHVIPMERPRPTFPHIEHGSD